MRVNTPSVMTSSLARGLSDLGIEADSMADCCAHLFAQAASHAARGAKRCQAAGHNEKDLAPCKPRLIEQHKRQARRLARAGRRDQHHMGALASAA
jgi:hypothetical protein